MLLVGLGLFDLGRRLSRKLRDSCLLEKFLLGKNHRKTSASKTEAVVVQPAFDFGWQLAVEFVPEPVRILLSTLPKKDYSSDSPIQPWVRAAARGAAQQNARLESDNLL